MTYQAISKELDNRIYHPIYFLYGDEAYFLDRLVRRMEAELLSESEKAFNQTVLYGRDTNSQQIIDAATRLPMMSNYQVLLIKEAQYLRDIEKLLAYIQNPVKTTIMVIVFKHKKPDKRKTFYKTLIKSSIVFESKKLYENQVPSWIHKTASANGYSINDRAAAMLTQYLGADLGKINNELEKIQINLDQGGAITEKVIEENVGISKDYNVFELQSALATKNVQKAYAMVNYFIANPKDSPLVLILGSLINFFTRLSALQGMNTGDDKAAAAALKLSPWQLKDVKTAARHYSIEEVNSILNDLETCDLKSKGVGNANTSHAGLLQELIFKILH